MTARGEDVLAWLDDAITQRENTAHTAAEAVGGASWDGWDREVAVALPAGDTIADGVMYGDLYEPMKREACEHIGLHDPESVLRRSAADRKLLELHGGRCHSCPSKDANGYLDEWTQFDYGDVCPVVQNLAEAYGETKGEVANPRIAAFREVRDLLKTEALRTDSESRYQALAWVVRLLDEMAAEEQIPPTEGDQVT